MKAESLAFDALDARLLLRNLTEFKKGDFSVRMPVEQTGMAGKIYDTLNEVFELNSRMASELERMSLMVGKQGKIRQRASLPGAYGGWAGCVDSVNALVADLVQAHDRSGTRHRRGGEGRPQSEHEP